MESKLKEVLLQDILVTKSELMLHLDNIICKGKKYMEENKESENNVVKFLEDMKILLDKSEISELKCIPYAEKLLSIIKESNPYEEYIKKRGLIQESIREYDELLKEKNEDSEECKQKNDDIQQSIDDLYVEFMKPFVLVCADYIEKSDGIKIKFNRTKETFTDIFKLNKNLDLFSKDAQYLRALTIIVYSLEYMFAFD
jgi:hypothetical protein